MGSLLAAGEELPLAALGQYGLAGIILSILLGFGWWVLKNERADRKEAEAEVKRLNGDIQNVFVPAQEQSRVALVEVSKLLARIDDLPRRRRQ